MTQQFNFALINLGCTKNLVDSQHFLGRLFDISIKTPEYQLNYFTDPYDKETNIVFVNTCGFLSAGREEADRTMHKLLQANKKVYLLGCAAQYYKKLQEQEAKTLPNLHYLSRGDLNTLSIKNILAGYDSTIFGDFEFSKAPRAYTNALYKFEYLKIAEGCDNHCTFCIISKIRGKQKSLPIEAIVEEATKMVAAGIEEIIIIAQDTTRYGTDIYGKPQLLELLKALDKIKGDFTYRLLYLYPDIVTLNHVKELKKLKKFMPYFDIPLQHISSPILKRMGRFYDEGYIIKFLDQIKKIFPVRFIRTNLIIGFPGETENDFKKLLEFVDETKFDNIALFEYHDEPLATSSKLDKKVDYDIIRARFTKMRQLVNRQLLETEEARKGKEEVGYIMELWNEEQGPRDKDKTIKKQAKKNSSKSQVPNPTSLKLVVRPWLHCPDIDSYDEISVEQVVDSFGNKDNLEVGDKIVYRV